MEMKGYKKLRVWCKADELAFEVYKATKNFLRDEIYGITSHLRRAALSVPTNIVEGYEGQNRRELKQFVNIALGSFAETEYLIDFSQKLGYLTKTKHREIQSLRKETGALLWKFYKSL